MSSSATLSRSGRKRARDAKSTTVPTPTPTKSMDADLSSESESESVSDSIDANDNDNNNDNDNDNDNDNNNENTTTTTTNNQSENELEAEAESESDSDVDPLKEPSFISSNKYQNKQRCLVLTSRGVTSRFRHLLEDIRTLLPHHKKDSKLDDKQSIGPALKEICEVKSCNTAVFLECRKRQDAYLWIGSTPNGPSAKFNLANVHTMDELKVSDE